MILHAGIDIAAATGTTVAAAAAGTVIIAGWGGNCGNMITLDHQGGLSTTYCHLSQIFVGTGQEVQRGQAIGAVGADRRRDRSAPPLPGHAERQPDRPDGLRERSTRYEGPRRAPGHR